MPSIDWVQVLNTHKILYTLHGPSVSKGNVYVKCPWCGAADQGTHMGISLHGKGFGCWRNANHRGRSPGRLLGALLGVSTDRAFALLGLNQSIFLDDDSNLFSHVQSLFNPEQEKSERPPVSFPKDIKPIDPEGRGMSYMFVDYLVDDRGYTKKQAQLLIKRYQLHYSMTGPFSYRLVIPIYNQEGTLATWTGRSIVKREKLRYRSLSQDPEKAAAADLPVAQYPTSSMLLNEHTLYKPGKLLVVGEGPLDAIRLDYAGSFMVKKVRGTCLFGKAVTDAQVDKLFELADFYEHKRLLLDPDATLDILATVDRLREAGYRSMKIPERWEDPAVVPVDSMQELLWKEIRGQA